MRHAVRPIQGPAGPPLRMPPVRPRGALRRPAQRRAPRGRPRCPAPAGWPPRTRRWRPRSIRAASPRAHSRHAPARTRDRMRWHRRTHGAPRRAAPGRTGPWPAPRGQAGIRGTPALPCCTPRGRRRAFRTGAAGCRIWSGWPCRRQCACPALPAQALPRIRPRFRQGRGAHGRV